MREADRIRDVLETHERLGLGVISVRTARALLAEVDRLRAAIAEHHHDVSGEAGEVLNTDYADERLWAALGDA